MKCSILKPHHLYIYIYNAFPSIKLPSATLCAPAHQLHLHAQELAFVEFFCGEGNVWKALRVDSVTVVGIDIKNFQSTRGGQNAFDILSDPGLAFGP